MTSRIIVAIVAIVAAVLSLAAPVAVDAQTPTLTVDRNLFGHWSIDYSGFPSGATYHVGYCAHATATPASCTFNSMGHATGGQCGGQYGGSATGAGSLFAAYGVPSFDLSLPYTRFSIYSNSNCTTEVASVSITHPTTQRPVFSVRGITSDSATIYVEGDFMTHGVVTWCYTLTPGSVTGWVDNETEEVGSYETTASPTHSLAGLSPGTAYGYSIYTGACGYGSPFATVTFTTLGGGSPPGPAPPTGVEVTATADATTDGSGSVTLSWSNPGDPDIASYEYYLRRSGGRGEWRTVAGSNADTTSVTIDLTTGEAVAGNARGVTPTVEWTVYLRARGVNGGSSRAIEITFTTLGSASEPEPPEEPPETPEEPPGSVPALPLAGLVTLAVVLFLGGAARRKGLQP